MRWAWRGQHCPRPVGIDIGDLHGFADSGVFFWRRRHHCYWSKLLQYGDCGLTGGLRGVPRRVPRGRLAWKHATAAQKLEPAQGFTPDQRFFVGMAQWACGDMRPEMKRERAITDPHSPLEYRINGVVSNMPEFATAFGCKVGQPMVRKDPCRVW